MVAYLSAKLCWRGLVSNQHMRCKTLVLFSEDCNSHPEKTHTHLVVGDIWTSRLCYFIHVAVVCWLRMQLHLKSSSVCSQYILDPQAWFGWLDHSPLSMHLRCIFTCTFMSSSTSGLQSTYSVKIQGVGQWWEQMRKSGKRDKVSTGSKTGQAPNSHPGDSVCVQFKTNR